MVVSCSDPLPLYQPRDPHASDLWQLLDQHFDSFQQVYDERYQAKYGGAPACGSRPIVEQSVFLPAGDQSGIERLIQYMTRCPFSLSRLVKVSDTGQIVYQAEKQARARLSRSEGRWNTSGSEAQLSDPPATGFSRPASPTNWAHSTDHHSALVPGPRART